MNKRKQIIVIVALVISLMLSACSNEDKNLESVQNNHTVSNERGTESSKNDEIDTSDKEPMFEMIDIAFLEGTYGFIQGDEAMTLLAAEDDYTSKLSQFDYASKYQSEVILNVEERKEVYETLVLDWSPKQMETIKEAMKNIADKLDKIDIVMPDIDFIITTQADEGGAAYTRSNAIILKPHYIGPTTSLSLERLIVHEMFHVYSRAHKDERSDFYSVIHYEQCEELVIPPELFKLTIANPDAPDNNFYIEGEYEGETYAFIPLIYSSAPYNIEVGGSFFQTLQDDMLAVEIIEGVPTPIYQNGELLILEKKHVGGYFAKIGYNTSYTYHPEETIADNFVALVFEDEVESPWVLEGLKAALEK